MSVRRFLVTASEGDRIAMWEAVGPYSNWIEGRLRARGGETWLVTVFGEDANRFLEIARRVGATVEEIEGGGDDERYLLRVGEPGSGWAEASNEHP
jgi:hypothetical protein